MKLAGIVRTKGNITREEVREFAVATKGALFLFDQKIEDYCRKLYNEALSVQVQKMEGVPPAMNVQTVPMLGASASNGSTNK
jgi:hypothetical protein